MAHDDRERHAAPAARHDRRDAAGGGADHGRAPFAKPVIAGVELQKHRVIPLIVITVTGTGMTARLRSVDTETAYSSHYQSSLTAPLARSLPAEGVALSGGELRTSADSRSTMMSA